MQNEHAVLIVGGGPTGLMLAGELALVGVNVAIIERRASQDLAGSRAGGLHARSLEVLDQRGIADRFVTQGTKHAVGAHFHIPLNLADCPTRHNYVLGLWQSQIERILAEWVAELKVPVLRDAEVTGYTQDDDGVEVTLREGAPIRARYLVGCDGGRSVIRKTAGIEFAGSGPTLSWLIAEASFSQEPKWGMHQDANGIHGIGKAESGGPRIVITERELHPDCEPTLRDVSEALVTIYGSDFGIHSPTWISRFTDMARQAVSYRDRRVLLAGDAAHVHSPMGGQGLNLGVQDAVNLAWKLAQVVKGISPDSLLDTYQAERYPVGGRVLRNNLAQVALRRMDDRSKALGEILAEILALDEPRKRMAAEMAGLNIQYDMPSPAADQKHPLLGRRMPDLELVTATGPRRLFTFLHQARPVLLVLDAGGIDIASWSGVQRVDAEYRGAWELPSIGAVAAPPAVLIRPDGHVAWVGDGSHQGLPEALTTWCGAAAA